MPRFSEETLENWTRPASDTEEDKLSNAERMVREAIEEDSKLSDLSIEVFGQGSYANNTNVRVNSDIDINVRYGDGFYFDLPPNKNRDDFDLNSPSQYSLREYKNDVERALVNKFGLDLVVRKNKCITVLGNSYRVETDVVPTWKNKRYSDNGSYVLGAKIQPDSGSAIVNYPKQHIENGKRKNTNTNRRFKRLTRIFKKVRYKMIEDCFDVDDSITSFLLECLIWNVPNSTFNDHNTWQVRLKEALIYLYDKTSTDDKCDEWGEVSELLYLFKGTRKWTRNDVNRFLQDAWNYLEY